MNTNTGEFAEKELQILCKTVKDPIVKDFIPEILSLVEKFGKSGQSGGSAPYTAGALSDVIKKLCMQQPICPVTGVDDEWMLVNFHDGDIVYQNTRCSSAFKDEKGQCTYLDAIVFKTPKGHGYTSGSVKMPDGSIIGSKQIIKRFPFKPKTFYINVEEVEVARDDWEFYLRDTDQLKPVFKYYNRLTK